MKKLYFFSLVLICIIVAASIIFAKSFCDNDEPAFDILSSANFYCGYEDLFNDILTQTGLLCERGNDVLTFKPIILYLERQEKSPPVNFMSSPLV